MKIKLATNSEKTKLRRVPLDFLLEKENGVCSFCSQEFKTDEFIFKVMTTDTFLPEGYILWEEVYIAHNDCFDIELSETKLTSNMKERRKIKSKNLAKQLSLVEETSSDRSS